MSKQRKDKIRELSQKALVKKIQDNSSFVAFYLKRFKELESLDEESIREKLGADPEAFEKLGFYKIGNLEALVDFCDECSSQLELRRGQLLSIVRHVLTLSKMTSLPKVEAEAPGLLMAARRKEGSDEEK